MAAFERAPYEACAMAHEVLREHHRGLIRLSLGVVFASGDGRIPAIVAKGTSPLHRAAGAADLLLVISEAAWLRRNEIRRRALLDHGLCSVEVVTRGDMLALDTAGRPRVRRVPKDVAVGYLACWRRWGEASPEAEAMARLRRAAPDLAA